MNTKSNAVVVMKGVRSITPEERKIIQELTKNCLDEPASGQFLVILQDTYKLMEEETARNGLGIFMRMFQEYPAYKKIFPKFRHITDSSLMGAEELRNHGIVYMKGLGEIIEAMDDDKKLGEMVKKIAMTHKRKGVHKHHVQHMLPMVLATLKHSVPPGQLTDEMIQSWTKLYNVIAELIEALKLEDP